MWSYGVSFATFLALSFPALRYIRRFPRSALWPAFGKAFFLWLISTSPVIGAILLSRPTQGEGSASGQFKLQILSSFTLAEMFVYTSAFLAPVLYVVFDIVKLHSDGDLKFERSDLANHMRGMQGVVLASIAILILTLLAYAAAKSDPAGFPETYLARFLTGQGFTVYLSSLLIWYSIILWDTTPKSGFPRKEQGATKDFAEEYAQRRGSQT